MTSSQARGSAIATRVLVGGLAVAFASLALVALFATVRVGVGLGASANCRKPPVSGPVSPPMSPPVSPPATSFVKRNVSQPVSPPPCPPATKPPAPPNICVTVNGTGVLREPAGARFELNIRWLSWKETFDGQVTYRDPVAGLDFVSTDFVSVNAAGDAVSVFGFGTANGATVQYLLEVFDGKPDRFSLWLFNSGYRVSSTLKQGNINVRNRC